MAKRRDASSSAEATGPADYRHVGSDTEITGLGRRFTNFGEKVTFAGGDEEARQHGGAFIPESDFAECGFTDEELEKYPNPQDHEFMDPATLKMTSGVPQDFLDKKKKALGKLQQLWARFTAPPQDRTEQPAKAEGTGE